MSYRVRSRRAECCRGHRMRVAGDRGPEQADGFGRPRSPVMRRSPAPPALPGAYQVSLSLSLSPPPGRSAGEGLARPSEAPEISAEADATCAEKRVRRKRTRRLRGIVTCPVCVVPYVNCQQEVDCASTGGTASELTASGRNPPSSRPTQAFAYYSGRYGAELTWTGNRG